MNTQSFNFSAVNSFGEKYTFVTGPSGAIAMGMELFERNVVPMEGAIALQTDWVGGVTALAALPATEMAFAFDVAGKIIGIAPIVSAPMSMGLGLAGAINMRGGLAGNVSMSCDAAGTLTRVGRFGPQSIGMSTQFDGELARQIRLSGDLGIDLGFAGQFSGLIRLSGSMEMALDATGVLSLNATAEDGERTMFRPKRNREMVYPMSILSRVEKQPNEVEAWSISFINDLDPTDQLDSGWSMVRLNGASGWNGKIKSAPYTAVASDSGLQFVATANITLPGTTTDGYVLAVANASQNAPISVGAFTVPAKGAVLVVRRGGAWVKEISTESVLISTPDDQRLRIWVAGGVNLQKYKVEAHVVSAEGRALEDEFILRVKED